MSPTILQALVRCLIEQERTRLRYIRRACLGVSLLVALTGCRRVEDVPSPEAGYGLAVSSTTTPGLVATPPSPGSGVVVGRLVDARSGLPVRDASVILHGRGRQSLSAEDGRFRFDAVRPGPLAIYIAPDEGHVSRSLYAYLTEEGIDFGLLPIVPASASSLIVPEYGGVVPGCGATRLTIATESIREASPVRLTCVQREDLFPAPPPAGRLPLAVVDGTPSSLDLSRPVVLTVELPAQPRYSPGVPLDLYRLDPASLSWVLEGSLEVDASAAAARGQLRRLGTYMLASPEYGALADLPGPAARIGSVHTAARPAGDPVADFEPDTSIVFLRFEYGRMENTRVRVATLDDTGELVFETVRPYSGDGTDATPMMAPDGQWPPGSYETVVSIDDAGPVAVVKWQVAGRFGAASPVTERPPPGFTPLPRSCVPPAGWYPYQVVEGDTLYALALRVGRSIEELQAANCLDSEQILIGQIVYLPQPMPPPAGPVGPIGPGPGRPPSHPRDYPTSRSVEPTTWYTPPAGLPTDMPTEPPETRPSATPKLLGPGPEPTLAPRPP